ncbi:MAG: phosphoglucosamine mutase [Spirochaetota bacterium]|nr:phosphoglucosamine mutase [Spirochaetota bacterium]
MASRLMKSVSGIRGVVGETLTPELIVKVASAFAKYSKNGTVVVGRDSRPSGEAISRALESALALSGCSVIDLGIVPTPTVQLMVEELQADGGIVISASHNPAEWNAFKLINSKGTFLNSRDISKFFSLMETKFKYKKWNGIGEVVYNNMAHDIHIKRICDALDCEAIRKRDFAIVLDSVNGAGSRITVELLNRLGCRLTTLNCEMNGIFPRGAEPLPENLKEISKRVIDESADIGFAQDPDADRLAIIDENGRPIGEENTIPLVVEHLLSKQIGRVVVNFSTTNAVKDIADMYGATFKRVKVGEINVVEDMLKNGARIGGEGNGGVISPEVHLGRDSLVGIGYILEMMAERGKTISQLVRDLPVYVMKKGKVKYDNSLRDNEIFLKLKNFYRDEKISTLDGMRIDFVKEGEFKGGWVHLRPSNTEPIFRIISEGRDKKHALRIYNHFAKMFKN